MKSLFSHFSFVLSGWRFSKPALKISILLLVGIILLPGVKAQKFAIPTNSNFFSYLSLYYKAANYNSADTSEGGENAEIKRYSRVWGPRLYPHGNFSVARNAIINYAQNYSVQQTTYNPNWICLGPSNTAEGNIVAKGVGQIHRITFAPGYNGITNKTIYAASGFGGLWRTIDDGSNWSILNTDQQLPISAVADVAVNYANPNMIFIAAGTGDGGILMTYTPNWANVNPIFTIGMYRSIDYGNTWQPINNGFLTDFLNFGGTVRRLISNPNDPKILLAATSLGIYRCINADETTPGWSNVLQGNNPNIHDFRSVEWKPGSSQVAYAGGCDNIYKTTDRCNTWQSIVGPGTGLDFSQLTNFTPQIINLAVTQADPDKLYALIFGKTSSGLKIYIYEFINNYWVQITSQTGYLSGSWLGLAASPIYSDEFYFYGILGVKGRQHGSNFITQIAYDNGNGFHTDVHVLTYQPNIAIPKLFCGNHGGVSVKDLSDTTTLGWEYRNNGLQNQLIWDFDDSEYSRGRYSIANQDCGVYVHDDIQNYWKIVGGGDGLNTKIMKTNPNLLFYNKLQGYKFSDASSFDDYSYRPNLPGTTNQRDKWDGHKNSMFRLPFEDLTYFSSCDIYKRLKDVAAPADLNYPENLWQFNSDLGKTESDWWNRQIVKVAFCEAEPDYIYVVTGGGYDPNNPDAIPGYLFKTTSGGNAGNYSVNKFTPLAYPGFGDDVFPVISGIAVHPENPNKVWLSMIGYNLPIQVAYSSDGGITWSDADPNKSLPNLPVNSIVYQKGVNDILYVGTDVGVYVRVGSGNWEKYGTFPNVRVTEMKINYCTNKLRVSTFGRSFWEGDLLTGQLPTITIQSGKNIVFNNSVSFSSNIIIEPNAQLTVHGTMNMPPSSKIIVKPNAKLIIDGGKITNGCGSQWIGIEVWGNSTQNQNTTNGVCSQGMVELKNGAVLENANNGITNWNPADPNSKGGIIIANGATFRNNRRSVEFMKYRNFDPVTGAETDNLSSFSNCTFDVTDSYPANSSPFAYHITLWDVKGVTFSGCDFLNSRTNNFTGLGIGSIDAGYKVQALSGTTLDKSLFKNFAYGIQASNSLTAKSIYVDNTQFTNNGYGIGLSSLNGAIIQRSLFEIGIAANCPNQGYGISMYACSGYKIEENTFTGGTPIPGKTFTGTSITSSGSAYNEIYKNNFQNLNTGNIASLQNGASYPPNGLTYLCNLNTGNKYDFSVASTSCISPFQRSATFIASGNTFSTNATLHFGNGGSYQVQYYHSPGQAPTSYYGLQLFQTTNINTCLSHISSGSKSLIVLNQPEIAAKELQFAEASSAYNNVKALYESLIDGGSTTNTVEDIENSMPSEMWELRAKLLGDSPHLSQDALRAASLKTDVIPQSVLFDILAANPDEMRDEKFLSFLQTKENPLPEYMIDILRQIAGNKSYKTVLQEKLNLYENLKTSAASDILRSKLHDSIVDQSAIINWLDNKGDLASHYQIVDIYLQNGNTGAAQSMLKLIPTLHKMSDNENAEYQKFSELKTLQINLSNNGRLIAQCDSAEKAQLITIADFGSGIASAQAQGILTFWFGMPYCNCVIHDENLKHAVVKPGNQALSPVAVIINANPNPATTWITFDFILPDNMQSIKLTISDVQGRTVDKLTLSGKQGQKLLDTRSYSPGIYFYKSGNKEKVTGKFVIK